MALVILFVSLIVAVHSQRFCVSTSLGTGVFSELNGQYVYKGGQNHGKNYYELDNTGQTDCANPAYLYYNSNPGDGWYVGESFAIYTFKCASITDPQDPSTCTNWVDGGGTTVGPVVTAGDCPYDAMCDTITLSQSAGNCSGVFNYIKPNQFTNGNGEYLIYQEKAEKWICWKNIGNVWGCPFAPLGIPNSWKQIDPSGMKRPFQNGDTQSYDGIAFGTQSINIELTCSGHNTHNPSPDPTYAPTYPTITPTKTPSNNPTITPTKYPSKTPTYNPSKIPSNSPTTPIPTQSPTTSNPTITPTFFPSNSPLIPTMIPTDPPTKQPTSPTKTPSIPPSKTPSKTPTESPTPAPTGNPTRNPTTHKPTASPTTPIPSKFPSKHPTPDPTQTPTIDPTNNPTPRPTSPTNNPASRPVDEFEPCIDEFILFSDNKQIQISIQISRKTNKMNMILEGPNDRWFGIGFGGNTMKDTYVITVNEAIQERKLGDHKRGTDITNTFNSVENIPLSTKHIVSLIRDYKINNNVNAFDFTDFFNCNIAELNVIWAVGVELTFGYHFEKRSSSFFSCACNDTILSTVDEPSVKPTAKPSEEIFGNESLCLNFMYSVIIGIVTTILFL